MALDVFDRYVETERLTASFTSYSSEKVTPRMFQYNLLQRALKQKKHIVLPEGYDERVLRASARLIDANVVDLTLIGEEDKIKERIEKLDIPLNINRINIVSPQKSPYFEDYVNTFYELRKHKNVNLDMAKDAMSDVSYFATMMIYKGHADGMVSGSVHSTQHTIRPALQFIKTTADVKVASSIFFIFLSNGLVFQKFCIKILFRKLKIMF